MLLLLLVACGARGFIVEEQLIDEVGAAGAGSFNGGSGGGAGGSAQLGGGGGTGGNGASTSSTDSRQPYHFETHQLARCQLGFIWMAGDTEACPFRFSGRCYEDEEAVCACACPRDTNSVCALSGFLSDPNNPLSVTCQANP